VPGFSRAECRSVRLQPDQTGPPEGGHYVQFFRGVRLQPDQAGPPEGGRYVQFVRALCNNPPVRTGRPARLTGFPYVGCHRYFLTFCTHYRRRHFVTADRVFLVHEQIVRAASEEWVALIAYCFMPDHVHLLVEGRTGGADCKRFIARAKQYSGYSYRAEFGERLWQKYSFERVLRDEEATLSVARYMLENPLRAGLVRRVEDHPFMGSDVWTLEQIMTAVQMTPQWGG
jgi:putative transposase